jgi:hypothetical protein
MPYISDQWLQHNSIENPSIYHKSFDNQQQRLFQLDDQGLTTNLRKANQLQGLR